MSIDRGIAVFNDAGARGLCCHETHAQHRLRQRPGAVAIDHILSARRAVAMRNSAWTLRDLEARMNLIPDGSMIKSSVLTERLMASRPDETSEMPAPPARERKQKSFLNYAKRLKTKSISPAVWSLYADLPSTKVEHLFRSFISWNDEEWEALEKAAKTILSELAAGVPFDRAAINARQQKANVAKVNSRVPYTFPDIRLKGNESPAMLKNIFVAWIYGRNYPTHLTDEKILAIKPTLNLTLRQGTLDENYYELRVNGRQLILDVRKEYKSSDESKDGRLQQSA